MNIYPAVITGHRDGDTIIVDIDLGFYMWIRDQPIRLLDVWAPETKGPEKEQGLKAKEWVEINLPVGAEVRLQTLSNKDGKYVKTFDRWVGVIFYKDRNFNEEINRFLEKMS